MSMFNLAELLRKGGAKAGNNLAVDSEIYSKFMQHLSQTVKHDEVTKNMAFLTALSAYTSEPLNLFLRGESSIGKTYNVTEALKYFPVEDVWLLGGLSPTALVHDKGKLVDEHGAEIDFSSRPNKPLKGDYPNERDYNEAFKTYRENRDLWIKRCQNSHYLVDLTGKILVFLEAPNIKTFNMLRPILSHDSFQISYKFTDKSAKGQLQTQHVVIQGFPACIFCTSDEKYVKDLATRSFTITPEITHEKFKAGIYLAAEQAAFPYSMFEDEDLKELRGYIEFLRGRLKNVGCLVPCSGILAETFTAKYPRSMRDFKHVLTLLKVHTVFHCGQRPCVNVEGLEGFYVLATKIDYDFINSLWEKVKETTETSAPSQMLKFYHEVFVPLVKEKTVVYINELADEYNRQNPEKRSSDTIERWLNFLCEIGYADKRRDEVDKRRNVYVVIHQENENKRNSTNSTNTLNFTEESIKAWWDALKKKAHAKAFLLREKFFALNELSIDDVAKLMIVQENGEKNKQMENGKNFVLSKNGHACAYFPSQTQTGNSETVKELSENEKFGDSRFSFKLEDIWKIERLTENIHGDCAVCGYRGYMDYQVTLHSGDWGLLCGQCGIELINKVGEVK